jgi:hypothetical protein
LLLLLFFGAVSIHIRNFQLVKVILHKVSIYERYQLIILMTGFQHMRVLMF